MRAIAKEPEPASLTVHRQTPHCDYDNYEPKNDLRHALVSEQAGAVLLLHESHSERAKNHEDRALEVPGAPPRRTAQLPKPARCLSRGHGQPAHLQHCDTRKGDRDLEWNPADPAHNIETRVRYEVDGSIHADDDVFNDQLNQVLNLNIPVLKNNREGILDAVLD